MTFSEAVSRGWLLVVQHGLKLPQPQVLFLVAYFLVKSTLVELGHYYL